MSQTTTEGEMFVGHLLRNDQNLKSQIPNHKQYLITKISNSKIDTSDHLRFKLLGVGILKLFIPQRWDKQIPITEMPMSNLAHSKGLSFWPLVFVHSDNNWSLEFGAWNFSVRQLSNDFMLKTSKGGLLNSNLHFLEKMIENKKRRNDMHILKE